MGRSHVSVRCGQSVLVLLIARILKLKDTCKKGALSLPTGLCAEGRAQRLEADTGVRQNGNPAGPQMGG